MSSETSSSTATSMKQIFTWPKKYGDDAPQLSILGFLLVFGSGMGIALALQTNSPGWVALTVVFGTTYIGIGIGLYWFERMLDDGDH